MPKKKVSKIKTKHIEALSKISEAITSEQYLEDILKLIVTVTAEVMNSNICSLQLINEEKNQLEVKATQSISEVYLKKPYIKIGEGIAGRVAKEGKARIVKNVKTDKYYLNRDIAKKENLCSLLSVPMVVKGKVIGVLNCYTSRPHKFIKTEITILTTVANQAAVAIRNTELMVKSCVIQKELEARKVVERAKEILMQEQNVDGDTAYKMIRKKSMDNRKSMREIAEAILLAKEIRK